MMSTLLRGRDLGKAPDAIFLNRVQRFGNTGKVPNDFGVERSEIMGCVKLDRNKF
jgi:hypothetical protein